MTDALSPTAEQNALVQKHCAVCHTDAATVNGFVTEALGHLPTPRERVVIGDFEFEVEDVHRRALVTTVARRVKEEAAEEDEE